MDQLSRPCPLCGTADRAGLFAEASYDLEKVGQFAFASRKLPEYMHYRLSVCGGCELVYADPAPDPKMLACAYRDAAFDSGREAHFAARTYADILRKMLVPPNLAGALDIGTGDGAFLEQLLDYGYTEVVGVEPSSAPIAAAKEHIRPLIRHGLFLAEDFRPEQFALVTCFQTLEHVPDPLGLCREVYRLLKPGGAMLCVVHNRRAWSARLLGKRSPIFDIEHLQLFSSSSARVLFERAGFRGVQVSSVFNHYPTSYWMRLFPLPGPLKSAMIAAADRLGLGRIPLRLPAGNLAVFGRKG